MLCNGLEIPKLVPTRFSPDPTPYVSVSDLESLPARRTAVVHAPAIAQRLLRTSG